VRQITAGKAAAVSRRKTIRYEIPVFFPISKEEMTGMKIGRYLALSVFLMGLLITFGDRGLVDSYMMQKRLAALQKENQEIIRENSQLRHTIALLKDDLSYIEMVARKDLGMVKDGDMVYQFAR
jgi:cell division protein FtsB